MPDLTVLADATTSSLFQVPPEPFGVIEGPDGAVYFTDISNHRIFRIDADSSPSVVVGTGIAGNGGDGSSAPAATTHQPYELRFDPEGNLFFVDMEANVVRRVAADDGRISTVAGTGAEGFSGDGGPATSATMAMPHSIEIYANVLYVADIGNHRIRTVDLTSGLINTIAGNGEQQPIDLDRPLNANALNGPRAIAFDHHGDMIVGLREGNAIYRVDRETAAITHVAGTGHFGYDGNVSDARSARLAGPKGIALSPSGEIVLADTESHTIRVIGTDGSIRTVAGTGEPGSSTDPSEACLNRPHGVFVGADGSILIGDSDNRRLLRLS